MKKINPVSLSKPLLFAAALYPALLMVYQLLNEQLGAEPVDAMLMITGLWSIRFLLITLAITPIRQRLTWNFIRYRRMLGLYAFFYALLHLGIYISFEQGFSLAAIVDDVIKRNFILVGMLAFLLFLPLVVTSTKGMMKRLGKRWKTLHKSTYWLIALALLHFVWIQKSDYTEPMIYVLIGLILFSLRKPPYFLNKGK